MHDASEEVSKAGKGMGTFGRIALFIGGLALLFLGLRGPILSVAGVSVAAEVTNVEQDTLHGEAMENNYKITYRFTPPGGSTQTGMKWMKRVFNAATLPKTGSTVRVRYLRACPWLNAPSDDSSLNLATLVLALLGIVLIGVALMSSKAVAPPEGFEAT